MDKPEPFTSLLRELLPLVPRSEKKRFGALLALAVIMAFAELGITGLVALLAAIFASPEAVVNNNPLLWLRMQTGATFGDDPRLLALAVLCAILFFIIVKNILNIVQQRQLSLFSEQVGAAARSHIFRFYQRAPFLWLINNGVADLNFGLNSAVYLANTLVTALHIITSILMIITLFAGLLAVSPLPSLMFLCVLGAGGYIIIKAVRKSIDSRARESYSVDYDIAKVVHLALHGLKEVRLYGRENSLYSDFQNHLGRGVRAKVRLQTIARLPVASLEILGFSTLVGVMLVLVFAQNAGMARISGIMGFMAAAAWRALPVANRLVDSISGLRDMLPYVRKTVELVRLEQASQQELLPLGEAPVGALPFTRDIVLDSVSFRYPSASSLAVRDVSFRIEAGSMVGIVGLSGAGKSTLVNVLTGLLPPDSGDILVDGKALTKENVGSWLQHIGYVAQAPYILDASLAENIALSRWGEAVNRERILKCCKMAALDFLDDLDQGMDTILGDRGTRLSGGQAQRVAIARALYSEPDLIIFDEATSALDMKNEKAIHETILSLRDKITMIIIAHRLTTIEGCDMLVWMDKGGVHRIGDVGTILPEYTKALQESKTPLE